MDLIGEDAISTINTIQAGHSPRLERKVYELSPESLLGLSKHTFCSCLIVSTDWQKATRLVPSRLNLPYISTTRHHFNALIAVGIFMHEKAKGEGSGKALHTSFDDMLLQRFVTFYRQLVQVDATTHAALHKTAQAIQGLKEEVHALQEDMQ
jgi:hypothetical protein